MCNKKLMISSFVWTLDEFQDVREAISRLPDDVTVMTKYVPQDWHRGDIHDPLIGQVGDKDQIIELDIAGEYFRGDSLAHCFAEELHQRFAYWRAQGVDGLSVRIDRGWRAYHHHDCVLDQVQESNLWCLGMWASGQADDIDAPLIEWASDRFGPCVATQLAAIARLCDRVVKEALTVCGEPFGDTRRIQPAMRSMMPPNEQPATILAPAKAENHIDPFCRWLALWRWVPELKPRYERLRCGDPELQQEKARETTTALAQADEAIRRLRELEDQLDHNDYEFLLFKLQENRHHLALMGHAAQAWLVALRLPQTDRANWTPLHSEIDHHLNAMRDEWQTHVHESAVVVRRGRTHYLQRCTYLQVPEFCRDFRRFALMEPTSKGER